MQASNWRKSAATFAIVMVCLTVVLLGGVYLLKQRSETNSGSKPSPAATSENNKKTDKNSKKTDKQKKTSSSERKKTDSDSSSNQSTNQSPGEVAAAGPSDYWYLPILGIVGLGLGGYEYYLSRQTLKQAITNR